MPGLVFYLIVFLAVGVFFLFIHLLMGHFIRPNRPDDEKMTIYECGEPTVGSAWIQFDLRYYVVALLFVVFDVEVAFFFPWAVVFGKTNELSRELSDETRLAVTKTLTPAELNLGALTQPLPPLPPPKMGGGPPAGAPKEEKKGGKKGDGAAKLPPGDGKKADNKKQGEAKKDGGKDDSAGPFAGGVPEGAEGAMTPPTKGPSLPLAEVEPIPPDTAKTWAWIAFADIMIFFGVLMVGFAYLWRRGDINWVRSVAAEAEP
jgi:NADH:ubiquinone oxidoreductase subunit 3 (subunit A)